MGGGVGEAVEHGGAVAGGLGHAGVSEGLEVPGDSGLGKLEDFSEFADGKTELRLLLEKAYNPEPDRIGEGTQKVDQVIRGIISGGGSCLWQ